MGHGQMFAIGGLVNTPIFEKLAENSLRYRSANPQTAATTLNNPNQEGTLHG